MQHLPGNLAPIIVAKSAYYLVIAVFTLGWMSAQNSNCQGLSPQARPLLERKYAIRSARSPASSMPGKAMLVFGINL